MHERGFTLVELMISMLLGLLLIAGALSVFLVTKQGYRIENGLALLQSTGRATLDLLTREILMSGYPQADDIEAIVPAKTSDGGGNNSDQLAIRYRSTTDCLNSASPTYANGLQYAKNMYFIQDNSLVCRTLAEDDSTIAQAVLVQGIENMQLLYGEDNDATDGATNATRYVTADGVSNWDNVVSVRIGILVNSQFAIATDEDDTAYTLLGQTQIPAAADRMRRRAYTATAVIRNRMQES